MEDSKVGQEEKDASAEVANVGFEALTNGDGDVVFRKKKMQKIGAKFISDDRPAESHHRCVVAWLPPPLWCEVIGTDRPGSNVRPPPPSGQAIGSPGPYVRQ
jgi:hypothetical protein